MKTSLLKQCTTVILFFLMTVFSFGQAWDVVGTPSFGPNPDALSMDVQESTGDIYLAIVERDNNNQLRVVRYDGTNWMNLAFGSNAIVDTNVSYPDVKINPFNNELWVAYRTDPTPGNGQLMVKRFDGSSWVTEGNNVGFNGEIPYEKIHLQFNVNTGHAYVAAIYEASGVNRRGAIVSNRTGAWADETASLASSNNLISHGLEFPEYNRVLFATVPNGGGAQTTTVQMQAFTGTNWIGINANNFGNTTCIGFGATVNNSSSNNFRYASFQDSDNTFFTNNNQLLFNGSAGSQIDPASLKYIRNPQTGKDVLLYTTTNGAVYVEEYDPSMVVVGNPNAPWTEIYGGILNLGTDTSVVDIATNESTGQIYITHKDGNSVTVREFLPNFQFPRVYVDKDATGANDGSSWANAFTDLQTGIDAADNTTEKAVWVAEGEYKPGSNRTDTFTISDSDTKLYGGFNGTETLLNERNWRNNLTILSGDLNGDDDNVITFENPLRSDNSYSILEIAGGGVFNTLIDGFTFTGGHANNVSSGAPNSQNRGPAILKDAAANNFTLKNCIIENNVADREGTVSLPTFAAQTSDITIEACIFRNNFGRYSAGFQANAGSGATVTLNVYNNLFYDNTAGDRSGSQGFSGSSFSANANSGTINVNVVNNTFTNNFDIGTQATNDKGTILLRRLRIASNQPVPVLNANVHNNIFYENFFSSGGVIATNDIGLFNQPANLLNSLNFTHNLTANETSLSSRVTNLTTNNNVTGDPLFTDALADDYKPLGTSPVIDAGDSAQVPSSVSVDLNGTTRIEDAAVDIGAYENSSAITYTLTTNVVGSGTVSPASGSTFNPNDTANLVATPAAGWQFDGWSGDITSSNANETLVMDSDKTVTATFSQLQYTLNIMVIGNGTVTPPSGTVFNSGETANLTATPAPGWQFVGWAGNLSSTNSNESLVMDSDKNIQVLFTEITFDLTMNTVGNGSVSPGNFTASSGSSINIIATPDTGWQFDGWTGDLTSSNANELLLMDSDKTVTANFSQIDYTININVTQGNGSVTLSPVGPYNIGDVVTLTAVPDAGFEFVEWQNDLISSVNPETITIGSSDLNIDVLFNSLLSIADANTFKVNIYPNPVTSVLNISSKESIANVSIYNQLGQIIYKTKKSQIDMSSYASGMYLVTIRTSDGRQKTKKIIVE